jgi:hypothetical protein
MPAAPDVTLSRYKRVAEEFRIAWDFVNDLETGDTIPTAAVTAVRTDTGATVAAFLEQPALIVGAVVSIQVQGGTAGLDYDVTFSITTTQGDVFERVVRVRVR